MDSDADGQKGVVRSGEVTGTIAVGPDEVFDVVTDVDRLPEWNSVIRRVVERPEALEPGAVWKVELKPRGMPSWVSVSRVLDLDRAGRRFRYRSATDDGNPSYGDWTWQVRGTPAGSEVTVAWELHPRTFWRMHLLSRVRDRALRKEVRQSIDALGHAAADEQVRGAS